VVKQDITILIADRNSHVRKFLQREMTASGYRVKLADNARQVIKWAFDREPLDLVILDPDLPDADESDMLHQLFNRVPPLPVVIHTYASEYGDVSKDMEGIYLVEKKGSSIERLKQVVNEILVEPYIKPAAGKKNNKVPTGECPAA
jgi:DNA-binding NtrC family response regulator